MLNRRTLVQGMAAASAMALGGCRTDGTGDAVAEAGRLGADGGPAQAELMKPGPLGDRSMGPAGAPVTVIEYASLTCPHCRQFHTATFQKFKKAYIDTGKVHYIFREFPIGRTAAAAAVVTRCAPADKFFILNDKFLSQQRAWVSQKVRHDAIFKVVAQTGMSRATFDSCIANQAIIDGLIWVKQRGREFGVSGTPTFFINGKKTRGALTFEQIKALIEPQTT